MKIITPASFLPSSLPPVAVTVGFFDGVHLGHQHLLRALLDEARGRGLRAAAVTFPESPRCVLNPFQSVPLLTLLDEKEEILQSMGLDYLIELPFTHDLSLMSATDFMRSCLRERYGAKLLMVGYNHHFGHGIEGGSEDYRLEGEALGLEVIRASRYESPEGLDVSSTQVRALLEQGDVETAAACLGRPYSLRGTVVRGRQLGRTLGYPTANLRLPSQRKLVPLRGVYAVRAKLEDGRTLSGMLNIGVRPTVDSAGEVTIEAHLFQFQGDLYGQELSLDLIFRMRDERPFSSLDGLKRQLRTDALSAARLLQQQP